MALAVRPISAAEHLELVRGPDSASLPAVPVLGRRQERVVAHQSLGWYDDATRRAASAPGSCCCARCRRCSGSSPTCPRARCSTGPRPTTSTGWLTPMVEHLRGAGAFGIRMGPPVASAYAGAAATVKAAIAEGSAKRLADVPPDVGRPDRRAAWPPGWPGWAGARRPRTPASRPASRSTSSRCRSPAATEDELLTGFNQLWRRNIKKADKLGVDGALRATSRTCRRSTRSTSRPPSGTTSPAARCRTSSGCGRRCAPRTPTGSGSTSPRHEGDLVAATTMVRVGDARLVLLRRLVDRQARRPRLQRGPVGDDARRQGGRRDGLRPARHHRHPRPTTTRTSA